MQYISYYLICLGIEFFNFQSQWLWSFFNKYQIWSYNVLYYNRDKRHVLEQDKLVDLPNTILLVGLSGSSSAVGEQIVLGYRQWLEWQNNLGNFAMWSCDI